MENKGTQAKQDEKINVLHQSMSKLERQMGQLAHELSQRKQGVFPSQVVNNPRHEAKAITILRSGRQVENHVYIPTSEEVVTLREPPGFERRSKHEQVVLDYNEEQGEVLKNNSNSKANHEKEVSNDHPIERPFQRGITFNPPLKIVQEEEVSLPYPQALWQQEKKLKKESQLREMIDLFKKVHINIPLLEAVKTIPSYAKLLKEMCMKKKKFKEHEQVALCEEVSAIIQRKLPPKLKDLGSFTIPSKIGETTFDKCLMDLGANRSVRYPRGILENVLVNVAKFVISMDFIVLDMEEAPMVGNELPIIFGRAFMATTGVKINVKKGTMSMKVHGDKIKFQIFPPLQISDDMNECYFLGYYGEARVRGDEKSKKEACAPFSVLPCSQGFESLLTPIKKKKQIGGLLKGALVDMGA
ncbi:uncharacterized protein LOC112203381 [Rosa chinensis]|uniref:uncharacterized protein LOC112203381 n=1 Tax=Rosa chinensis TaxID=74649 RepID=UPI000D086CA0|nr:uncharacterized protein LOC112203381 [Rosa chinensis]